MKKVFGFIFLAAIFVFDGCKEIGPPIVLQAPPPVVKGSKLSGLIFDSTYIETSIPAADAKRVMMEEFSGQQCPNCPMGHIAVDQIIAANTGKVSAATLHTSFFAPQSDPIAPVDFRTTFATDIINDYGAGVIGIPCAMIDRVLFSAQSSTAILTPSTWSSFVTTELAKTSYVNIVLNSSWDAVASQDSVTVALHFTSAITADSLNLSLMITEDNIVAPQDSQGITLPNHIHNHILRTMITPSTGIKISASKVAGRVVLYKFRSTVIDITKWQLSNLKVIAFVHKQNSGVYDIVQVAEAKVQ